MLKETGIDEEATRRILSIMGVKELGHCSELGEGSPAVQELTSLRPSATRMGSGAGLSWTPPSSGDCRTTRAPC